MTLDEAQSDGRFESTKATKAKETLTIRRPGESLRRGFHSTTGCASSKSSSAAPPVRPLLKWAGGKRQLLRVIRQFHPKTFGQYIEPFLGGGGVFFDLYNQGLLADRPAILMDNNSDLVGCYHAVRNNPAAVLTCLSFLEAGHRSNASEHYYTVRAQFNLARRGTVRAGSGRQPYTPRLAAMMIYLNRTGYNGLFRLNKKGEFNVPVGGYKNPQICQPDNLQAVATESR